MANKYDDIIERLGGRYLHPAQVIENSPITEQQLAQYEIDLGYALPTDYREFLRDYGGICLHAVFPLKDDGKDEGAVSSFFGLWDVKKWDEEERQMGGPRLFELEWAPGMRNVLQIDEGVTEIGDPPRELLPIAIDQGGNQVYLALAGLQPEAVFLWMNWDDIYLITDSFDEFMHSLRRYD